MPLDQETQPHQSPTNPQLLKEEKVKKIWAAINANRFTDALQALNDAALTQSTKTRLMTAINFGAIRLQSTLYNLAEKGTLKDFEKNHHKLELLPDDKRDITRTQLASKLYQRITGLIAAHQYQAAIDWLSAASIQTLLASTPSETSHNNKHARALNVLQSCVALDFNAAFEAASTEPKLDDELIRLIDTIQAEFIRATHQRLVIEAECVVVPSAHSPDDNPPIDQATTEQAITAFNAAKLARLDHADLADLADLVKAIQEKLGVRQGEAASTGLTGQPTLFTAAEHSDTATDEPKPTGLFGWNTGWGL